MQGRRRGGRRRSAGRRLLEPLRQAVHPALSGRRGRPLQVGRAIGQGNLPIMTLNAIVQAIVPPPKYTIDSLFPCRVGGRASIRGVVVIERGDQELRQRLSLPAALRTLVENTDDAYGFPPFATFAPLIEIDGADYAALRQTERMVIARMLHGIERWQLRDPQRAWADTIPGLFADGPARPRLTPVMAGPATSQATCWAGVPGPSAADGEPVALGEAAFQPLTERPNGAEPLEVR